MDKLIAFLNSLHPLSPGLLEYLATHIKVRELAKRQMLLKAGHVSRHICFIDTGLLRCYYLHNDREVSSWFMKEGDLVISIESFYLQQDSYEYIQALEDCVLYYIDYAELQYIYRHFSEFNFIGRVLTERYYILWARQLYGLRMQTALARYEWLLEHHAELVLRVPAKFLASWLGVNESHLSVIKGR